MTTREQKSRSLKRSRMLQMIEELEDESIPPQVYLHNQQEDTMAAPEEDAELLSLVHPQAGSGTR